MALEIKQFRSCSDPSTTKDFLVDTSVYTPGVVLYDNSSLSCWECTEQSGTTSNTNYVGPYDNCILCCVRDTVTPKGVLINITSNSIYSNCTVYTGLTESTVTGSTYCVSLPSGSTCNLTDIDPNLLEIYVKLDCEGCCQNIYRVNLDDCCGSPIPCSSTTWITWTGDTGGNFVLDSGGTISLNSTSSSPMYMEPVYGYNRLSCPDKNPDTNAQSISEAGTYTYTFSQPVLNPLLAIYSIGQDSPPPGITVTMSADTSFSIYCSGVSDPSYQITYNLPSQTLSGDEGYGIIQFNGSVTQIILTFSPLEYYTQLTWGLPCADP